MTPKLVIALQYWDGDHPQAQNLARMIADIELVKRPDIEFVLVRRFDARPFDPDVSNLLADKFALSHFQTKTPWTGWPAGPNAMALDFLYHVSTKPVSDGCGVLLIEPDCIPLSRDWLSHLMTAWDVNSKRLMMGAWRPSGGQYGHVNGNAMMSPAFATDVHLKDIIGPDLAWDAAVAPYIHGRWDATTLIKNRFRGLNATKDIFTPDGDGPAPVLCHGFKDDSAYILAKDAMKL